jgi:excisionase family DNA binding protein
MNGKEKLLTVKEARKYLSLSERTLQRLSQQGNIRSIKMGGQWKYLKEDIEGYLQNGIDLSIKSARIFGNSIEKRDFPRINCALPCCINVIIPKKKEINSKGIILNISEGGLFLENSNNTKPFPDIKTDDPIDIEFVIDDNCKLNANGRVVRIQDSGIAVKFRNLNEDVREGIGRYIG